METRTLIAGHKEVKKYLAMSDCIEAVEAMFRSLATGKAILPLRQVFWNPEGSGAFATMPSYLESKFGAKIITVFPKNQSSEFESHQGAVLLFDAVQNGRLLAMIDATSITATRTAAASAVATRVLARKDSEHLAILGSGAQARSHLEAIPVVRKIRKVSIWSRNRDHARRLASEFPRRFDKISVSESAENSVRNADIVCTTTSSKEPILKGSWLPKGIHINAVGSSTPANRELDSDAVRMSKLFVDRLESAVKEAGDFIIPYQEGIIREDHIRAEIGDVIIGKSKGRDDDSQITLFKSLGIATEDLVCASLLFEKMGRKRDLLSTNWVEFAGKRENWSKSFLKTSSKETSEKQIRITGKNFVLGEESPRPIRREEIQMIIPIIARMDRACSLVSWFARAITRPSFG